MRLEVARNPKTPIKTLLELLMDEDTNVRHAAVTNPTNIIPKLPENLDFTSERTKSSKSQKEYLIEMSKDDENDVRVRVAKHPKTPKETLKKLASDGDDDVRIAVAENLSAPFSTLKRLAVDKIEGVRFKAILNIISRPASEWKKE